jgi:nitroreductase
MIFVRGGFSGSMVYNSAEESLGNCCVEGRIEMDAIEAIHKRRSVREYTGELISKVDLEKIVDAGRMAATGYNRQPWDFIVITDPDMIDKLTDRSSGRMAHANQETTGGSAPLGEI